MHKQDLELRPLFHQREDQVHAHILVCFLAYVLWKCLGQMCKRAGLGNDRLGLKVPNRLEMKLQNVVQTS